MPAAVVVVQSKNDRTIMAHMKRLTMPPFFPRIIVKVMVVLADGRHGRGLQVEKMRGNRRGMTILVQRKKRAMILMTQQGQQQPAA